MDTEFENTVRGANSLGVDRIESSATRTLPQYSARTALTSGELRQIDRIRPSNLSVRISGLRDLAILLILVMLGGSQDPNANVLKCECSFRQNQRAQLPKMK